MSEPPQDENEVEFYLPHRHRKQSAVYKFGLSRREIYMLQELADGATPKELRDDKLKERAIWWQISQMRIKMDARTTAHAIAIALRSGIIR